MISIWIRRYIDESRKDAFLNLYEDYKDLFHNNPGSTHIHQNWKGGLADHLVMMFNLAYDEYALHSKYARTFKKKLPFTLSDAIVVIMLHDAEKVIVYGDKEDPRCKPFIESVWDPKDKATKEALKWNIISHWQEKYNLRLTNAEINAIKYTHGEGDDYRNDKRVMNELAAFVGNIDRTSARIFYDCGKGEGRSLR